MYTYICFDLETTGSRLVNRYDSRHRVVQLAATTIPACERFERVVNPGVPIPPSSTRIHHLSNERVQGCPAFEDVLPDFLAFCRRQKGTVVLVAHNALGFDIPMLRREFQRASVAFPDDWLVLDTLLVARHVWRHRSRFNLGDLYRHITGTELVDAHNAAVDVEALRLITEALLPHVQPGDLHGVCPNTHHPDETRLLDVRGIGPYRCRPFVGLLNSKSFKLTRNVNTLTLGDLRSFFSSKDLVTVEDILRTRCCLYDDDVVVQLLAAIYNSEPQVLHDHLVSRRNFSYEPFEFHAPMRRKLCQTGVRTATELLQLYAFEYEESPERFIQCLVRMGLRDQQGFTKLWNKHFRYKLQCEAS